MGFDLSQYETVAQLNKWFQENYPMGRIRVEIISDDPKEERMAIWAAIYRDANDNHPCVENIARGRQSDYPRQLARFYAEDLATSAIGRCITLLKGGNTATQDDMKKVDIPVAPKPKPKVESNDWDSWVEKPKVEPTDVKSDFDAIAASIGAEIIEEIPHCKHFPMHLKEGTGKTGKPYRGYVCKVGGSDQCPPIWMELNSAGKWVQQKAK